MNNIGKKLTWDEVADIYDKATGRHARTMPMDDIFEWAEKQSDKFWVDPDKGTLHRINKEDKMATKKQTTAIEKQAPKAGEIKLNLDNVRKYVAPTGTVQECEEFLNLCAIWDLNPFKGEIYFIKYAKDKPATTVVGYEVYLKRAERQKMLKGWKAWTEGGADPTTGKKYMKACIKIHRSDWDEPFEHEVYFEEYAQYRRDYRSGKEVLTKFWKEKPRTMLKKVVIGQGFRMCFPDELGGMPYTSEEMPEALPTEPIIEATIEEESAPKPEPEKKAKELPKPKVKKKPTLSTLKKPTVIPDVPPDLLDDGPPKEGISKEEYEKTKKMDSKAADALDEIGPTEAPLLIEPEPEKDGEEVALQNAIEQKLNLLDKHFKRDKIKLVEKIHLVLSNKFGVTVAKFPDDLSKEQLTYTLELLQVTVDNEDKKLEGKK